MNTYKYHQILKYLASGATAFLCEYVSFLILFYVLNFYIVPANVLSFILGFVISFMLNRNWVFTSNGKVHKQLIKYLILALVNLLLSTVIITVLSGIIDEYIAKIITVITIAAWNYFIYRKFIFLKEK